MVTYVVLFLVAALPGIVLNATAAWGQNPAWVNFTSAIYVRAVADDGAYLWVGGDGLTRLTKSNNCHGIHN